MIKKMKGLIIIQFKIFYKNKIFKFQKNGVMHYLIKMKILKP